MLAAGSTARPPLSELYVIVNSKLGPEFSMPSRSIASVLGRAIAVALTQALRSQLMLVYAGAQRHGIDAARRPCRRTPSIIPRAVRSTASTCRRSTQFGVAAGKNGTAFEEAVPDLDRGPARAHEANPASTPQLSILDFGVGEPHRQPPGDREHQEVEHDERHQPGIGGVIRSTAGR